MNAALVEQALADSLAPRLKLTMFVLAALADDAGNARAPMIELARHTGMGTRRTAEAIVELEAQGRILRERRLANAVGRYAIQRRARG